MKLFARFLVFACIVAAVCGAANLNVEFKASFPTGRIIKGEDAQPHSAPYIVSLSRTANHTHTCGGTIIAKDWVLTAAHCISQPVGMSVIAGLHVRTEITEVTQQRFVDFGRIHSEYTSGIGPYDVALLHLSEAFVFTRYVQPAVLPAYRHIPSGNATLYGWGLTSALGLTLPKTLQTVVAHIMDWNDCKDKIPATAPLAESNVCTDFFGNGISACSGDSGGPLVQEIVGAPAELIGIVSWGYVPCGFGSMPSIYTRVSAYMDWIVKIQNAYYTLY